MNDFERAKAAFEKDGKIPAWVIQDPALLDEMAGLEKDTPFGQALVAELTLQCDGNLERRASLQPAA